jgi:hypothetical protein
MGKVSRKQAVGARESCAAKRFKAAPAHPGTWRKISRFVSTRFTRGRDGRIITRDGLDFDLLARDAATRRQHGGLVVIWSPQDNDFCEIVIGVSLLMEQRPRQRDW